jgi:hypothetical protein
VSPRPCSTWRAKARSQGRCPDALLTLEVVDYTKLYRPTTAVTAGPVSRYGRRRLVTVRETRKSGLVVMSGSYIQVMLTRQLVLTTREISVVFFPNSKSTPPNLQKLTPPTRGGGGLLPTTGGVAKKSFKGDAKNDLINLFYQFPFQTKVLLSWFLDD